MYKVIIPEYIVEDLKEIKEYIFRFTFSEETSSKIVNEILTKILWLKILPFMFPLYKDNLRVMTIRKKYRIFYKVNEEKKEVKISYIFWTEQDYNTLIH